MLERIPCNLLSLLIICHCGLAPQFDQVYLWCRLNQIVTHATAIVLNTVTVPMIIGFLATKCLILIFALFQPWVSDMQHKAEDSVLLVVFDAFCKRGHNMLAVVGDHAICCLQHVQNCCIQCACMQIANLNTTRVLRSSSRSSVEQTLMCYGRRSASGKAQKRY